jgi:hypothetical protein
MRLRDVPLILFLAVATLCCVTQGTRIEDVALPTPSSIASNKHSAQPDPSVTAGEDWLSYEPVVVELRGKLIRKLYYGPPNYGENPRTDSRELLPFLQLSKPVNVRGSSYPAGPEEQSSVANVWLMELVMTIPHESMIGKNVIVTGTLFHGFTGHHHTDVLMDVRSLRLDE